MKMILAMMVGLAGCSGCQDTTEPSKPVVQDTRPSLVLVTVDTTRQDRIGAYGYADGHTPHIDGLAKEGIRYQNAYATVPLTIPAHSSMFTGLYPTRHGVRSNGDAILSDDFDTLAEMAQQAGYRTGAAVSAFVTTRVWNLDQGFDTYEDDLTKHGERNRWRQERPANEVVDDALAWARTQDMAAPLLLWVHLYDPHRPLAAPDEWVEKVGGRPYDAEIAFMDDQIGRLRTEVEGIRGNNVSWIVVGDHGEALTGEHGETDHGLFLFQPTMSVPFIVKPAGEAQPRVDARVVSGVDVLPTALSLMGIPIPGGLDGVDVVSADFSRKSVYMEAYASQTRFGYHPELAVVEGDLKLMATPKPRLFDVALDPKEEVNLAGERQGDLARLQKTMESFDVAPSDGDQASMSADVIEQLAALGYMSTGGVSAERSDRDAKDHVKVIRRVERARKLATGPGREAQAEKLVREVLRNDPNMLEANTLLARLLTRQQKHDEADALFRAMIARDPNSTQLRSNHADALARAGRFDDAIGVAESVLAQVPGDEQTMVAISRFLMSSARANQALTRIEGWLAENLGGPALRGQAGVLYMMLGRPAEAEPHLRAAVEDGTPKFGVWHGLGMLAKMQGDLGQALVYQEKEVAHFPGNREARWALADLYMDKQAWDLAADEYRWLAEEMPQDQPSRRAWAQAVFNSGDYTLAQDVLAPLEPEISDDPAVVLLQVNILDKLGHKDEAKALFERGQKVKAEDEAQHSLR